MTAPVEPISDADLAGLNERLAFNEAAWAKREALEPGFQRAMLVHFDELRALLARLDLAEQRWKAAVVGISQHTQALATWFHFLENLKR